MLTLFIDGKLVSVPDGSTLLDAVRAAGVDLPTLCHHPALEPWGGCRLCLVEVSRAGAEHGKTVVACLYPAEEGLSVTTRSAPVEEARRVVVDLLLARCPGTPLVQELAVRYGIRESSFAKRSEPDDCVLCGLCVRTCDRLGTCAISSAGRGVGREISPPFDHAPPDCIGCLACAAVCPTHHIRWESGGLGRTIWGKQFALVRCPVCGTPTQTEEELARAAAKSELPLTTLAACPACRRAEWARKVRALADGRSSEVRA